MVCLEARKRGHTLSAEGLCNALLMRGTDDCSYEDVKYELQVGKPADIADMGLCSNMAGFISEENICIDGGMTKQMIYQGDHGWI